MNFDSALSRIDYSNCQKWDHAHTHTRSHIGSVIFREQKASCIKSKITPIKEAHCQNFRLTGKSLLALSSANRSLIHILFRWVSKQFLCVRRKSSEFSVDSSYLTHKYCLIMTFVWKYDERQNKLRKLETFEWHSLCVYVPFCAPFVFKCFLVSLETSIFLNQSHFFPLLLLFSFPHLHYFAAAAVSLLHSGALFFTLCFIAVAQLCSVFK